MSNIVWYLLCLSKNLTKIFTTYPSIKEILEMTQKCLEGRNAALYIEEHLVKKSVDLVRWETVYEDLKTGELWLQDLLYPEVQGGGVPRLRSLPLQDSPEVSK